MKKNKLEITKRGVLYVTKLCNANCAFCYFRYEANHKHFPIDAIVRTIKLFKEKYHLEYVDITGGEPTIHPDIVNVVKACVKEGIKPTIITNGHMVDIIAELIDNGLEDLLISVHGYGSYHNQIVGVKNAFDKITKTINYLGDRKFKFRINTVLTKYSCESILELKDFYIKCSPRIVNFISFNPYEGSLWSDKHKIDFQVSYSTQALAVKSIIDELGRAGIWVNVRYFPLCLMRGYEKHVCNFLQLPYDPYEWEYTSSNRAMGKKLEIMKNQSLERCDLGKTEEEKLYFYAMQRIIKGNKQVSQCSKCSYNKICDHIYSQYLNEYGDQDYTAVPGKIITDPLLFRKRDLRWSILKNESNNSNMHA